MEQLEAETHLILVRYSLIKYSININKFGFGLVEVLIAVGLVGIISLAVMSLTTNTMKSQKGIQAKDQQRDTTAELRQLVTNKTACLNSFGGQNPQVGFSVVNLKDALNANKYSINTNDKTGLLSFREFRVDGWAADAGYTTQGNAEFKVKLSKVGDTGTVKDIRPDVITLRIKRDGAGNITECYAIGDSGDGFWQASSANPSDIFYSGGKVGVGVTDPVATLDVAGSVKIADDASSCDVSKEGSMRYNSVIKNMEFCNGTTWTALGGSVPTGTLGGSCNGGVPLFPATSCTSWACGYFWAGSCLRPATCASGWSLTSIGGTSWGDIYIYTCVKN